MPAIVPRITSVMDKVMSSVLERINTMQEYSGGGIFFRYITAASGNVYDKVCMYDFITKLRLGLLVINLK